MADITQDTVTVPADEWAVDAERAERCLKLERAIRAFFRESYIDLTDPRIDADDFSLPRMRELRDLLDIQSREKYDAPIEQKLHGPIAKDGFADHPFEGYAAHEGLGPCREPRDWCHADCGLPQRAHHPYSHFIQEERGIPALRCLLQGSIMPGRYPIDESAPCWWNDGKVKPADHDFVYLGLAAIEMPLTVVSVNGVPITQEDAVRRGMASYSAGPFILALHRCVRCGLGLYDADARADSREPTPEEYERLAAYETARLFRK